MTVSTDALAMEAARQTIELITSDPPGVELDPSTVDLLTLNGLEVADWIDGEERAAHVDAILARYESIASRQAGGTDVMLAIAAVRGRLRAITAGTAWEDA